MGDIFSEKDNRQNTNAIIAKLSERLGVGTSNQGAKIMDAVMTKNAKMTATGGWEYAVFDPTGKPKTINAAKDCHSCHTGVKKTDFVFHNYIP